MLEPEIRDGTLANTSNIGNHHLIPAFERTSIERYDANINSKHLPMPSPIPYSQPIFSLHIIQQIIQVIVIPPAPSALPRHHNLLHALLLLLCHTAQQVLELFFRDLLPYLPRPR